MTDYSDNSYPSDICLLLRCHGEQRWLSCQVMPVLHQIEDAHATPDDELGAALAYLEVLSIDGSRRAAETEAAFAALLANDARGDRLLHAEARQYYAAVRSLRDGVTGRVQRLTGAAPAAAPPPWALPQEHATL